ncbi:P-loop containing nucleoside triphosphate hydrolase protein, partial [Trametes coccinea BRFM310]
MEKLPTLVLDQVGVGKTMQAIGAIAMYEWLRLYYDSHHEYMRGLEDTVRARANEPLKSGIHVVVCTNGLVDQWIAELHRCLKSTKFVVLPYTGTCLEKTRKPFWDTVKNLQETRPGLTVIVVTTYIAVAADVSQSFSIRPGGKKETLGMIPKRGGIPAYTLFAHDIATVVADEVHNVRKPGVRRTALYQLLSRCELKIGMTATPIVTEPMDAVHLARLFDIEGFNDDMVDNLRKAQQLESKKARRQEDALANRMEAVNIAFGAAHEEYVGPTKTAMFNFVDFLRRQLARYVIHRTPYSKTKDGKPIQDIPPVVEVPVVVELTEEEMQVQTILAERLCEDGGKDLASFYIGIRQALLHHCSLNVAGYELSPDDFQYEDSPSTKINALLALLSYHVGRTCAPPAIIMDGQVLPPEDDAASTWNVVPGAAPDKIIVYSAFPSLFWIITAAFELLGFQHIVIHGSLKPAVRTERLKAFQEGDTPILLMSNVGTVGLNIAVANILIVVDNLWSAQETEQLVGRVWRHPQKKTVIHYSIIADNTSDVFIASLGSEKGLMHRRFMGQSTAL